MCIAVVHFTEIICCNTEITNVLIVFDLGEKHDRNVQWLKVPLKRDHLRENEMETAKQLA